MAGERADDVHKGTIELPDGAGSSVAGVDETARARVADRILGLIAATRDLCDSCADLADALRPLPGSSMDDPLTMDFARLRAERTATLLDEAASAARGTLGLLDSSYRALGDCAEHAEHPLAIEPAAGHEPSAPVLAPPFSWPGAFTGTSPGPDTTVLAGPVPPEAPQQSAWEPPRAGPPEAAWGGTDDSWRPAGADPAADPGRQPEVELLVAAGPLDEAADLPPAYQPPAWQSPIGPQSRADPSAWPDSAPPGPEAPTDPSASPGSTPRQPESQTGPTAWPDSPPPQPEAAADRSAWPDSPPPQPVLATLRPDSGAAERGWAPPDTGWQPVPKRPTDINGWPGDEAAPAEPPGWVDHAEQAAAWAWSAAAAAAAASNWTDSTAGEPAAGWTQYPALAATATDWSIDVAATAGTAQQPAAPESAPLELAGPEVFVPGYVVEAGLAPGAADPDSDRISAMAEAGYGGPLIGAGAGSVPAAGTVARTASGTEAPDSAAGWRDVADRPSRPRADDRIGAAVPFAGRSEPGRPEFLAFGGPDNAADGPAGEGEADGPPAGPAGRREDRGRLASFFAAAGSSVQTGADRQVRNAGAPAQAESRAPAAESGALAAESRVQRIDHDPAPVRSPDQAGWPRHASPADPGPPVLSVVPAPPELPLAESRSLTIVPPLTRPADLIGDRSAEPAREAPTLLDEPTREQPVAGLVPAPRPAIGPRPVSEQGGQSDPASGTAAAVLARQVEAARRHLQAAVLVAHDQVDNPRLAGVLDAVENVLGAIGELARQCRAALGPAPTDRTFPGEARFLCAPPWERYSLVSAGPGDTDPASPGGLARLLRALGYDAYSVTGSTGVAGVQVRSDRCAAHVALVEPAGGGRQRWSGALEWMDPGGTSRTWAETLGPVELDEEELARRVDEMLRRCVGPAP